MRTYSVDRQAVGCLGRAGTLGVDRPDSRGLSAGASAVTARRSPTSSCPFSRGRRRVALACIRDRDGSRSEVVETGPTIREKIDAVKLAAAYGFGIPKQVMELSGPGGGPVQLSTRPNFDGMSDSQVEAFERLATLALPSPDTVEGEVLDEDETA